MPAASLEQNLAELKQLQADISTLNGISSLLGWDQNTYMPEGGAAARGRQMSLVSRFAHEKRTDPRIGQLLDELETQVEALPEDSPDRALVRVTRRSYDRFLRIPAELMAAFAEHRSHSFQVWSKARPVSDFQAVIPELEKTLDYSRKMAECFPGYDHIADPLIDFSDFGMQASSVRQVFAELRSQLVPLVQAITSQPPIDASCLHKHYPSQPQLDYVRMIAGKIGYDFQRGRMDLAPHPFMTKFAHGDIRITTRVREDDVSDNLFSVIHECGHAMYEQGIDPEYQGTYLSGGTSAGVHESQSRLWENIVGRSRGFWEHFYPSIQAAFPEQLAGVDLDTFHRAINKVTPSLIRTDADEVTYNLHVMIRFDFELALLEGSLAVKDLADAWIARYEADLGVTPPDHKDGVMQDIHWYSGVIGGSFQGYTLGNLLSAQFYETALKAHPDIPQQIGRGEFSTLYGWLRENIYRHGSVFTAPDLVERVTGQPMHVAPLMRYLTDKYTALYNL